MKKEEKVTVSTTIIIAFILITIITPIVINIFLFLPFPSTPSDLENKDWLSFWGSFLGGCIEELLLFLLYTIHSN